jgi:hypothetical protein
VSIKLCTHTRYCFGLMELWRFLRQLCADIYGMWQIHLARAAMMDLLIGKLSPTATPSSQPLKSTDVVEWWRIAPKQTSPPRRNGLAPPGSHGRFVVGEVRKEVDSLSLTT